MTGVGASEEPPEPAPKEAVRGHDEARPPSPAAPRASTLDGQIDAYVNQIAVESRMGATVASINPAASVAKPAFMRLPAATSAVLSETLLCASDSIVPMMQAPDATKLVPDSPAGYSASHMTRSLAALRGQGPPPWPSRTWSTDDDEWECGPASRGRCRPDSDDDDDDDDATDDEDGVLVQEEEGPPASPSAVGAAGAQAEAERAAPEPKRAAPEAEAEAECAAPEQKTAVGAAGAKAADEGPGSEAAAPEPHMAATLVAFPNSIRAGETIRLRTPPFFSEVVFSPPLPAGAKAYVVACGPAARMLNADDWSTACGPNWGDGEGAARRHAAHRHLRPRGRAHPARRSPGLRLRWDGLGEGLRDAQLKCVVAVRWWPLGGPLAPQEAAVPHLRLGEVPRGWAEPC
jgi:hypothetical protein